MIKLAVTWFVNSEVDCELYWENGGSEEIVSCIGRMVAAVDGAVVRKEMWLVGVGL